MGSRITFGEIILASSSALATKPAKCRGFFLPRAGEEKKEIKSPEKYSGIIIGETACLPQVRKKRKEGRKLWASPVFMQ